MLAIDAGITHAGTLRASVSSDRSALRETIRTLLAQITTHAPSESINAHGHSTLTRDTGFEEQRRKKQQ